MSLCQSPPGKTAPCVQNLCDAGCDPQLVERFFALRRTGQTTEQLRPLQAHRRALPAAVHENRRHFDGLDFLIYQLTKQG